MYPSFFNHVKPITLFDPLAATLGAPKDGMIEIHYQEIVKMAGHSCPTVSGAFLMTQKALKALYGDETPLRGGVKIGFPNSKEEGVTGVIASVMSNITGASDDAGFKGLKGKFTRHSLLGFDESALKGIQFTRLDTGTSVVLSYHPELVPPKPQQMELMQKLLQGSATQEEKMTFGTLWQERVEAILLQHCDDEALIVVETGA
jgi:hypothetical protein